jgi:hypothetical protein
MSAQVSFTLRGRNSDVPTCIANPSDDEAFAPRWMGNRDAPCIRRADGR